MTSSRWNKRASAHIAAISISDYQTTTKFLHNHVTHIQTDNKVIELLVAAKNYYESVIDSLYPSYVFGLMFVDKIYKHGCILLDAAKAHCVKFHKF